MWIKIPLEYLTLGLSVAVQQDCDHLTLQNPGTACPCLSHPCQSCPSAACSATWHLGRGVWRALSHAGGCVEAATDAAAWKHWAELRPPRAAAPVALK